MLGLDQSDLTLRIGTIAAMINAGGQAKSQGGKTLTQADLGTLYEERRRLQEEVAAESNESPLGMVSVQINDPN